MSFHNMLSAAEAKNLTSQGQSSLVSDLMLHLAPVADKAIRSAVAVGFNATSFTVACEERLVRAFCAEAQRWFESLGYSSSAERCTEYEEGYTGKVSFNVSWK